MHPPRPLSKKPKTMYHDLSHEQVISYCCSSSPSSPSSSSSSVFSTSSSSSSSSSTYLSQCDCECSKSYEDDDDDEEEEEQEEVEEEEEEEDWEQEEEQEQEEDNSNPNEEPQNYFALLHELSKLWLSIQLSHKVSLKAADHFWAAALECFPKLYCAKMRQNIKRKTPQFVHERRKLYKTQCPTVNLNFTYRHKATNQIVVLSNMTKTPRRLYDHNPAYEKLFESATIKVILPK